MKKADPRLMLIMSMTVFGTLGLFVRNIPVSSGELALYRAVLAALLIGVYLLVSRQKIPFARIKKEVPLLLGGAANPAPPPTSYRRAAQSWHLT